MKNNINVGDLIGYATGPIESITSLVVGKFYKWVKIKQLYFNQERTFWIKAEYLGKVDTKFKELMENYNVN